MPSDDVVTLSTLIAEHPEWKDLPIVVLDSVGEYHWIGHSGLVYEDATLGGPESVLVFTGN